MIHICIRPTLDWKNQKAVDARLLPAFRLKFDMWNATFEMPYQVFRQRVQQIAQLNHSRVEGATCSAIEDVPSGHVIVPVDDDDWFSPDLANRLRQEHDPRVRRYLWRREVIESPRPIRSSLSRMARLLGRADQFTCKTNNYAVVNEPGLAHLALNHVRASEYFDAHPSDIKRIPATLAIQNRNLASQTALAWNRPSITQEELLNVWYRYRHLYSSRTLGARLSWAKPYVDLMAELMHEIHVK